MHLFLPKKLTTLERLNTPPNLTRTAKTVLKINPCYGWGCTSCPRDAITHFPCKLRLKKNFFHRPGGGAGAPTAPPGYAYEQTIYNQVNRNHRPIPNPNTDSNPYPRSLTLNVLLLDCRSQGELLMVENVRNPCQQQQQQHHIYVYVHYNCHVTEM